MTPDSPYERVNYTDFEPYEAALQREDAFLDRAARALKGGWDVERYDLCPWCFQNVHRDTCNWHGPGYFHPACAERRDAWALFQDAESQPWNVEVSLLANRTWAWAKSYAKGLLPQKPYVPLCTCCFPPF